MFKDIRRFIKDLFTGIVKKISPRKIAIISVCVVIALIPTIIAIWNVYFKNDDDFVSSNDVSIIFVDLLGDQELINDSINEKSLSDSSEINMLYNIVSKKTLASTPETNLSSPNFKLTITVGESSNEYLCFFSEDHEQSYLTNQSGTVYAVNELQYNKFLSSEYSDTVYNSAIPPALTTDNGATVAPSDVKWYFKKSSGIFERSYLYTTTQSNESYQMSKSVALNFSIQPTECLVNVFEISQNDQTQNQIYSGGLDKLAYITVQDGSHLYFEVKASWSNSDNAKAYGEITYKFTVDCKDYATFELSSEKVVPGQFVTIVLHDLGETDEVLYSTDADPSVKNNILNYESSSNIFATESPISFLKSFTPTFNEVNGSLVGFLPIPYGTPSGTFRFTIACGVTKKTFDITVDQRAEASNISLDKSAYLVSNVTSVNAMNEIASLLKQTADASRSAILCTQAFNPVSPTDYSRIYSYSDQFYLNEKKQSALSLGSFYSALSDEANYILAANSGIVTYTGYTQHLGSIVIIDHGMGICTWYCNLSDIDVRIGDAIAKGELLGKAGESPLMNESGVLILCSVYNTFIDPKLILGKEIY